MPGSEAGGNWRNWRTPGDGGALVAMTSEEAGEVTSQADGDLLISPVDDGKGWMLTMLVGGQWTEFQGGCTAWGQPGIYPPGVAGVVGLQLL